MKRSILRAAQGLALSASLLSVSVLPAQAASLVLGDSSEPDRISGYAGTMTRLNIGEFEHRYKRGGYDGTTVTATATTYAGMQGITWSEDKDKPCEITAQARALNPAYVYEDGSTAKAPSGSRNVCKGKPGNEKTVAFSNSRHYVRGVAVCTTDKQDSSDNRLKGIKLYAAEVNANGSVAALNAFEKSEHTNCKIWHPAVECSAGAIVSGLRLYEKDGAFTGLGLKCRRVEVSASPNKPK